MGVYPACLVHRGGVNLYLVLGLSLRFEEGGLHMKITLTRSHKYYAYVGKRSVCVQSRDCGKYKCFAPHNWMYTRSDGRVISDFRCNTRENFGCPDGPDGPERIGLGQTK